MELLTLILGPILAALFLTVVSPTARLSSETFIGSFAKSLFGIVVPVAFFFLSTLLTPEWKGEARFGWIDCFHYGKLALLPLVAWAIAAFYALEILKVGNRHRRWIVLGMVTGAVISTICTIHGLITVKEGDVKFFLSIPLYVSIWYGLLSISLIRSSGVGLRYYFYTLLGSLPFWAGSVLLSRLKYDSLPTHAPDCFVVTAASKGHERVVGPFVTIVRGGRVRRANRQLIIFWTFEELWRRRTPRLHRSFRRIYNVWGYRISQLIATAWCADLAYVLLKPIEGLARLIVKRTR